MEVRFHKRVRADLDAILDKYYAVSLRLGDDFFAEFHIGVKKAVENPRFFHFDRSGLRRCNLDRFPYHFLYDVRGEKLFNVSCRIEHDKSAVVSDNAEKSSSKRHKS